MSWLRMISISPEILSTWSYLGESWSSTLSILKGKQLTNWRQRENSTALQLSGQVWPSRRPSISRELCLHCLQIIKKRQRKSRLTERSRSWIMTQMKRATKVTKMLPPQSDRAIQKIVTRMRLWSTRQGYSQRVDMAWYPKPMLSTVLKQFHSTCHRASIFENLALTYHTMVIQWLTDQKQTDSTRLLT